MSQRECAAGYTSIVRTGLQSIFKVPMVCMFANFKNDKQMYILSHCAKKGMGVTIYKAIILCSNIESIFPLYNAFNRA